VWLIFVVLWGIVATIFGLAFVPRQAF
jgi:hypothetical protein